MDAERVYRLLQEACCLLDDADEHVIAAYVNHGMSMIQTRFQLDTEQRVLEDD